MTIPRARTIRPVVAAWLALLLLASIGCTRVRTETRRDILGRPIVTTYKSGPGGTTQKNTVRGDQPYTPPGSIFGGGGTWYVNGRQVNSPPQRQTAPPVPFLPDQPADPQPAGTDQ